MGGRKPSRGWILFAVLPVSCGFVFSPSPRRFGPPGTALKAFKRDVGLGGSGTVRSKAGPKTGGRFNLSGLDAERAAAYRKERLEAQSRLEEAMSGGFDIDRLPSGASRTDQLARSIGLMRNFDRASQAADILRTIIAKTPAFYPAIDFLAESHYRRDEFAAAEAIWRELSAALPDNARLRFRLVRALEEQPEPRKQAEVVELLTAMIGGRDTREAARMLALRNLRLYRAADAEAVLRRALKQVPDDPELQLLLAQAMRFRGQNAKAAALLEPLADHAAGNFQARAIFQLIWAWRALGEFDKALARHRHLVTGNFPEFQAENRKLIEQLGNNLQEEKQRGARVSFSVFELRHRLREGKSVDARRQAVELLTENAKTIDGVAEDLRYVQRNDPSADVRADALLGLLRLDPTAIEAVRVALSDSSPRNRMVAAAQLRGFGADVAKVELFGALGRESDAAVFTHMHGQLVTASGESFFLESGAAATAAGRKKVLAEWAERLGFSNGDKSRR